MEAGSREKEVRSSKLEFGISELEFSICFSQIILNSKF
jgi:hypothetical protein